MLERGGSNDSGIADRVISRCIAEGWLVQVYGRTRFYWVNTYEITENGKQALTAR